MGDPITTNGAQATKVKIKYTGLVADVVRDGASIARVHGFDNSYIDLPPFTHGLDKVYGKSIYATNVDGVGMLPGTDGRTSLTGKFVEFEKAYIAAAEALAAKKENAGIEFEISGYEEEIFWTQMAQAMVAQGFYTEVGTKKFGVAA